MTIKNSTTIVFVLQRLDGTVSSKDAYFVVTLLVYLFTILVNLTLIMTIIFEKTLHEPMFIFICSLCVTGIMGASSFYPKILVDLSSDVSVTTYTACLGQIFVIYTYIFSEFTTLTVMAYDRYVAICKPLNYHSIISPQKVMKLLLVIWMVSISETIVGIGLLAKLPICGFNLEKIYCTAWAVSKLSCEDTTINNIYFIILSVFHVSQAGLILISYVNISKASVRSQEERNKFMQTCLPHLITLINLTVSAAFDSIYGRFGPTDRLHALRHFLSVECLVVPPILNPLIYGLKMNKIRQRIFRSCTQKRHTLK